MKKIMKKVFSFVLALVMIIGIIPMTAKASTELPVGGSPTSITYDGLQDAQYTYTAENAGTLTIEFGTIGWICYVYEGATLGIGSVQVAYGDSDICVDNKVTANLEAGKTYLVVLRGMEADTNILFIASFSGGTAGGAAGSSESDAIEIQSNANVSVEAMTMKYYKVPTVAGKTYNLSVSVVGMGYLDVYAQGRAGFGYAASAQMGSPANLEGIYATGDYYVFAIQETGRMGVNASIKFQEAGATEDVVGTETNPDELPVNEELANPISLIANERELYLYYYTWTAEATGKLSIAVSPMVCTNWSWQYSVSGGEWETLFLSSADETVVNPGEYYVREGEELTVWFSMPDYTEGQVYFTASFEECEYPTVEEEEFMDIEREDTLLYVKEELVAVDTTHTVPVSDASHTLYTFTPAEAGVYEVTVTEGSVGYYGPNTNVLTNPTTTAQEITVTIQSVGQSAIIGLTGVTDGACDIKIEKKSNVEEETPVTWTDYANKIEINDFASEGDFENDYAYVDVEDEVVDKAVLGTDGYYHLNTANGPILFVKLDGLYGSINPLGAADNSGLMGIYDQENNLGYNYSKAYKEYYAAADEKNGLYPLTDDLIQMYQVAGATQGWYNANLGGVATEDGWMFNCYYSNAITGGTTSGGSTSTTPSIDSPKTGDNANVAVWAIVMVVAAGAAFVVAESKRRAR